METKKWKLHWGWYPEGKRMRQDYNIALFKTERKARNAFWRAKTWLTWTGNIMILGDLYPPGNTDDPIKLDY